MLRSSQIDRTHLCSRQLPSWALGGPMSVQYPSLTHRQVLCSTSHQVIDLYNEATGRFDLELLEHHLTSEYDSVKVGYVVSPSFGEVNTVSRHDYSLIGNAFNNAKQGDFTPQMREIRNLCDKYHAWIHVDAGARTCPKTDDYQIDVPIASLLFSVRCVRSRAAGAPPSWRRPRAG